MTDKKRTVEKVCAECGRYLGTYYGYVDKRELIDGKQYKLCPFNCTLIFVSDDLTEEDTLPNNVSDRIYN